MQRYHYIAGKMIGKLEELTFKPHFLQRTYRVQNYPVLFMYLWQFRQYIVMQVIYAVNNIQVIKIFPMLLS
ncbi:hypothetical protein D3C86_1878610 [compost metagenome]